MDGSDDAKREPASITEREKWTAELSRHERDFSLRSRELAIKESESHRSRWSNPLVLAILAAALAGIGNAVVASMSAKHQLELEKSKHDQQSKIEESKAEYARILEAIKAVDPDVAAKNLRFLVEVGLVSDEGTEKRVRQYLKTRAGGEGAFLSPLGAAVPSPPSQVASSTPAPGTAPAPSPAPTPTPTPAPAPAPGPGSTAPSPPPGAASAPPTGSGQPRFVQYRSGWVGGGNNQVQMCEQGRLTLQAGHPGKNLELASSDERSKKDILGRVEYMYFCIFKVT